MITCPQEEMRVVINDYRHIYDEFEKLATLLNILDWKKRDMYDFNLKHGRIDRICYHPTTGVKILVVRTDCGMVCIIGRDGITEEPKKLKSAIIRDVVKVVSYEVEWECPNCGGVFYDDFEDDLCGEFDCQCCGCLSFYEEKK